MSDWRTTKRSIQERIHRYGTNDPDTISRALAEAIRFYSRHNFWFNEDSYDFTLTDGTENYGEESSPGAADGYPADMLKAIKLSLKVSNSWYDITNMSISKYRKLFIESSYKGYPEHWTWYAKEFLFEPAPNGDYTVRLDYTKDIGTPVESYDGSNWSFTDSTDGTTVDDGWTNDWMTEAADLVVARACWWLLTHVFRNTELGMLAKAEEEQQLKELFIDSEHSQVPGPVRPWI
jgi:hypothetical protein